MQEFLGFVDAVGSGQFVDAIPLGWIALGWFVGLMNDPKKIAALIVKSVKKFVPGPMRPMALKFLDRLAKGIDKEIPDEIKQNNTVIME